MAKKNYDVSEEELDDLFNSPSNDLKSEAIKALKNSSSSVPITEAVKKESQKSSQKLNQQQKKLLKRKSTRWEYLIEQIWVTIEIIVTEMHLLRKTCLK